jgi:hypothetical protein
MVNAGANQWELIIPLIAVVAVVVLLVIVWRVQVYRLKHRPLDLSEIQTQLLAELGLGLSAKMTDTQAGFTVTVTPLDTAFEDVVGSDAPGLNQFQTKLISATRKRLQFVPAQATVEPGPAPIQAFIVIFPKSEYHTSDEFATDIGKFDREVQSSSTVFGGYRVTSATIACTSRPPRELSRNDIMRIGQLGEGAFGEVFKAELTEFTAGHKLEVITAVKSLHLNSASEQSRNNLLKEGALMGLLHHRNVLSLVGVVTAPRDMSVLLVTAYCENGSLIEYLQITKRVVSMNTKLTFCAEVARGMDYVSARRVVIERVFGLLVSINAVMSSLFLCNNRCIYHTMITIREN